MKGCVMDAIVKFLEKQSSAPLRQNLEEHLSGGDQGWLSLEYANCAVLEPVPSSLSTPPAYVGITLPPEVLDFLQ